MTSSLLRSVMSGDDLKEIFLGSAAAGRLQVDRHQNIYLCGDANRWIYFVESGSVRVSRPSVAGRDCLLRIEVAGGIFGEPALLDAHERIETATAREKGVIWKMQGADFWRELRKRDLLEPFVSHLILRMADQDRRIAHLITESSLRRLGKTLLMLAHRFGTRTREGFKIGTRISHEELADLVGTTRPRVSTFLCDLRRRNLIGLSDKRHLVIHEERLRRFLGDL